MSPAFALLSGGSEVGSEPLIGLWHGRRLVIAAEFQEIMMAVLCEPRECYSLRESRCFCSCLLLRHPWECGAGAVSKVRRVQWVQ